MDFFTYTPDRYQSMRNFDYKSIYIRDMALGLSKLEGISLEEARTFITNGIESGLIPFKDPQVRALRRDENRDKYKWTTTMSKYLQEVQQRREIIAPTFTAYLHPMEVQSELSIFTEENVNMRSYMKKQIKVHATAGRPIQAAMADNGQKNAKENNNSTSGAMTVPSDPIYNRSGHSTLTSVCRTCASTANANTERFTMGKRHFMNEEVVIKNILNTLNNMDIFQCQAIIDKYQLHYVTEEEFLREIKISTDLYFRSKKAFSKIEEFVKKLTDLERTVYLYTGDFYHVRLFNEQFVRDFFEPVVNVPRHLRCEDPDAIMKTVDEDEAMLTAILFNPELEGVNKKGKKVYFPTLAPEVKTFATYNFIAAGIQHIRDHLNKYRDFIECFWRNDCFPSETGQMPDMVRTAVLGGDTDSTLFTVMSWVEWYTGKTDDSLECVSTAQFIIFLVSMMVKHYLAIVSGVMGVQKKRIHQMAMKNEFFFATFTPTRRTKHYYAMINACEGLVYKEPDIEIKGVGLLNRKAPPNIVDEAEEMMMEISERVYKEGKISIRPYLDKVAKLEYEIYSKIVKGDTDYVQQASIKQAEIYSEPMKSIYAHYDFWESVFAPKYGNAPPLPIQAVKVSAELKSKRKLQTWLESIEDKELAKRIHFWLERHGKSGFSSFALPYTIISEKGIPIEIRKIMDIRKMIYEIMSSFYAVLETLNLYMVNGANTRLVLDEYPELFEKEEDWAAFKDGIIDEELE